MANTKFSWRHLKVVLVQIRLAVPERFDSKRVSALRLYVQETSKLLIVGAGTYGAENITLHSWDFHTKAYVGKYCQIADNVHFLLGGNHDTSLRTTFPFHGYGKGLSVGATPLSNGDIRIGNDVWIGSHVSVMSGVKIGNGAVIAAFSHVVKDVADYEIVGGNPASHVRYRFSRETINELNSKAWWNWSEVEIEKKIDWLLSPPE